MAFSIGRQPKYNSSSRLRDLTIPFSKLNYSLKIGFRNTNHASKPDGVDFWDSNAELGVAYFSHHTELSIIHIDFWRVDYLKTINNMTCSRD